MRRERILAIGVFLLSSFSITMIFFFKRGFLFSVDLWGTPRIDSEIIYDSLNTPSLPVKILYYLMAFPLPGDIFQKIFLTVLFFSIPYIFYRSLAPEQSFAKIIVSLLYLINPFVYERFMAGHLWLLLGYAIMPLALRCLYDLVTKLRSLQQVFLTSFVVSLVLWADIHYVYIIGIPTSIAFFLLLPFSSLREMLSHHKRKFLKQLFFFVVFFLVLNAFWIIPQVMFSGNIKKTVGTFTTEHIKAYAPVGDDYYGLYPNLLGMYGYFLGSSYVELPKSSFGLWWIVLLGFLLLPAAVGIVCYSREGTQQFSKILVLSITAIISILLAAGYHFSLNTVLFEYLPFYKGMRESEKFIAILVYCYAILSFYGYRHLVKKLHPHYIIDIAIAHGVVIITYTHMIFGGSNGQLQPVDYPQSWYQAEDYLARNGKNDRVLVLPWRMYVELPFNNNKFSINPARVFFSEDVLMSRRGQRETMLSIEDEIPTKDHDVIETLLKEDRYEVWKERLQAIGVTHVLVNKVRGFYWYQHLMNEGFGKILFEDQYAFFLEISNQPHEKNFTKRNNEF